MGMCSAQDLFAHDVIAMDERGEEMIWAVKTWNMMMGLSEIVMDMG